MASVTKGATVQPNIVFILVDNIGWGAFGAYGGTIPTPRIDKMASEGIRFNNYNVEAQCTPTRSAILTGRHPVRSGTLKVPYPGEGLSGLAPWEYTTAELLSDVGYATALYGKWHVGDHQGRLPNDQGFDEWWGIPNSSDEAGYSAWPLFKESGMPEPMIWEGKKGEPSKPVMPFDLKVRPLMDGEYIIPKTVDYIKRNAAAKKPFFVYVGYTEMHPPVIGHPDFVGKSTQRGGLFADIIGEMDYRVGQVLDAVKEAGVDDNTIVILSSDNGSGGAIPQIGASTNGPWRGDFLNTPFEGSMRVPAIIRWPGNVPAGVVTNEMLAAVDWLPTLAGIVGAPNLVPKDRPIDGVDASAFMLGKSNTTGRDSYVFFGTDGQLLSIKWEIYKTIFRYTETPALEKPYIAPQIPMMYDLTSDPHEDNNLIYTDLTCGWLMAPNFKLIGEYQRSVKQYPNIKPGEEFTGYDKPAAKPGRHEGKLMNNRTAISFLACFFLTCTLPLLAQQKGQWVPGQYGLNAGVIPSPGMTYANMPLNYSASQLNDSNGNHILQDVTGTYSFWVDENIFFYVPKHKILGGYFMPYLALNFASGELVAAIVGTNLSGAGGGSGLADMWVEPVNIGWHIDKRLDFDLGYAFVAPTGRYTAGASDNVGSGYWGNNITSGTTLYITKNQGTTANLATDWETHGQKTVASTPAGQFSKITPGEAFTDEWGFGQVLPLKKDMSMLSQLGLVGYDQWQVTANGGNYLIGRFPVSASIVPYYSVHAIGGQGNFIMPAKNVVAFFKYYNEYSAKARPEGRTIVFGFSWTLRIPKAAPPKS